MSVTVKRLAQRMRAFANSKPHHTTLAPAPGISVAYRPTNATALLWNTQTRHISRLEFPSPPQEGANLLSPLVLLGTAGLLGYYLYVKSVFFLLPVYQ